MSFRVSSLLTLGILFGTGHLTTSQQPIPPPPKPAVDGPSLAVTTKFVVDKLSDIATVRFEYDVLSNGQTYVNHEEGAISSVKMEEGNCGVDYHAKGVENGMSILDGDTQLNFKQVMDIVTEPTQRPGPKILRLWEPQ